MFNKSIFYDSEALLQACSQKLVAWQEKGDLGLEKLRLSKGSKESKKQKHEAKSSKSKQEAAKQKEIVEPLTPAKPKRRRSTFHRFVETADFISQLAKNTKSSSAKIKKPVQSMESKSARVQFKTSGLVATAISQPKKKVQPLHTPLLKVSNDYSDSEQENFKRVVSSRKSSKKSQRFKDSAFRKVEKT